MGLAPVDKNQRIVAFRTGFSRFEIPNLDLLFGAVNASYLGFRVDVNVKTILE